MEHTFKQGVTDRSRCWIFWPRKYHHQYGDEATQESNSCEKDHCPKVSRCAQRNGHKGSEDCDAEQNANLLHCPFIGHGFVAGDVAPKIVGQDWVARRSGLARMA